MVCRGTQDGENVAVGLESARWTKAYHSVPARAAPRLARAHKKQPCAGLGHTATNGGVSGRWPGPRPREYRGTTVAGSGYGLPISRRANTPDPANGANPVPANRSTREGKFAGGCGIAGMPTATGIPRLQPWEEVKYTGGQPSPPASAATGLPRSATTATSNARYVTSPQQTAATATAPRTPATR